MTPSLNVAGCICLFLLSGCYAPLHSPGIPAHTLPDTFRSPMKAYGVGINYSLLTREVQDDYVLGHGDVIKIEIAELVPQLRRLPPRDGNVPNDGGLSSHIVETRISKTGEVLLPLIGNIRVSNMTLEQARDALVAAYSDRFLDNARVAVTLVEASTIRVMVLGNVARPAVYDLPKYENDIAHAIAMAGGMIEDRADEIQVHRRTDIQYLSQSIEPNSPAEATPGSPSPAGVLRIPVRPSLPVLLSPEQAILNEGDVVIVRSLPDEVFFVVGKLSSNNLVRFTLGRENRDLGNGFVLPKDRDIDVVTAVAMAGYIDPIDSPTTVTVHRTRADGSPMLIHVDLIAARYSEKENVMVQGGDIIYLNPDAQWWFRRTLDRVIPTIFTAPYVEAMERWINPQGFD